MNLWECMTSLVSHGENKSIVSMEINVEKIVELMLLDSNISNDELILPQQSRDNYNLKCLVYR